MLDKLKDLFSTKKEPDQMATTTKEKTAAGKSCSTQATGPVEQISAVGECETSKVCCEAVREKAYLLWEAAGYPESDGVEFWLAAEKELQQ